MSSTSSSDVSAPPSPWTRDYSKGPPPSGDLDKSPSSNSNDGDKKSSSESSKRDSLDELMNYNFSSLKDLSFDNSSSNIVGAAVGALVAIILIIIVVIVAIRRKRKARKTKFYANEAQENPNSYFGNNGHYHHHNQMMKYPSQAGGGKTTSSQYGWVMPPLPPTMMNTNSMSSNGFNYGLVYPPPYPGLVPGFGQSNFSYEDLAAATHGFARSNLLGQGGFGHVYKGILPNGKEVAVKSLKANSGQGEREFQAEVDIISRVHHRYLVSLVGYCTAGSRRMLVYEYVPNGNLEFQLHGEGRPPLEWSTRLRIALGAAKGFAYLHEDCNPRIIHRDIKAANILLDANFEAKIADFGLAKLSQDPNTHVSTRVMGTFGYLAPEYASTGKLTEKSDVYSFGIMLLELITGRRPVDMNSQDDDNLIDWATPILYEIVEGGKFEELVDPRLGKDYNEQEMYRTVCCVAACIRQSAKQRPKMSQIVRALEDNVSLDDLCMKEGTSLMGSRSNSDFDLKQLGKSNGASPSTN